jgi:hypothetical protein
MAKKPPVPPIRAISILVGVTIGCILAYVFQVNLPTLFFEMNVASLVVFLAIPLLVGFIVGLLSPDLAVRNGLYVGFFAGLFNSIVATIKLIFAPILIPTEAYAFSVFAVMSVFVWAVLAASSAMLAQRFYD